MTDDTGKKIGRTVTAYPPGDRPPLKPEKTLTIYQDIRKHFRPTQGIFVADETTWGIAPDVGAGQFFALDDHTHGSPPDPGPFAVAMAVALGG
jgi:hypothetical protein